ncbi:hypothetical protein TUMSATVNIG1_61320 (plasmid) [Vibrio nigripulchritudo]|uniref:DUF6471 domain-containing protein n=1 Tax=Vibrio nigripulchritudo TaxID=28173 RepID=UPI00190C4411|nr:DUF6471 domain-containing protein [Vibrio nigripulchritudo]BCL74148.1 hypothetical protein VNTUMSATTG_60850 [Vibrio nigripulchritudo]BDU35523.1 hypothetical protein TUMSATVNIG1_61320 [Vibrio nigripulchritudo]
MGVSKSQAELAVEKVYATQAKERLQKAITESGLTKKELAKLLAKDGRAQLQESSLFTKIGEGKFTAAWYLHVLDICKTAKNASLESSNQKLNDSKSN